MDKIVNDAHTSKLQTLQNYYAAEDVLVFDIETTGFTAEHTALYLIGCAYYEDHRWKICQWFNQDGLSEEKILREFLLFCKDFKYFVTYNGDGFDIPYLTKKTTAYGMENPFSKKESIDIYKQIRFLKEHLHLENMKQKSVERFLGIHRLDKYSGGDLIKVYQDYVKLPVKTNKRLLLQHNYEDIEGLLDCASMLAYCRMKAGCLLVRRMSVRQNRLLFSLELEYPLPKRLTIGLQDIIITGFQNEATINVPIYTEELKFFFDNYKEYYYLPAEDMAVHKSVANYVDKNYREPAKRETCYLRKQGYFISQLDDGIMSGYKRDYTEKESFIELTDSFLQDLDLLHAYARHIIRLALS